MASSKSTAGSSLSWLRFLGVNGFEEAWHWNSSIGKRGCSRTLQNGAVKTKTSVTCSEHVCGQTVLSGMEGHQYFWTGVAEIRQLFGNIICANGPIPTRMDQQHPVNTPQARWCLSPNRGNNLIPIGALANLISFPPCTSFHLDSLALKTYLLILQSHIKLCL